MSDLIDQVNEDLRQEQLKSFWKENGPWILGGIALAIIFTGTLSFWRSHEFNNDLRETAELVTLQKAADTEGLQKFAVQASTDHAVIARFAEADARLNKNDKAGAEKVLHDITRMRGLDKVFLDLAVLKKAYLAMDASDPAAILNDLDALSAEGRPWRFSALEAKASLLARMGKNAEAAEVLTKIAGNAAAPEGMRARALDLHELYSAAALSNKPKATGQ